MRKYIIPVLALLSIVGCTKDFDRFNRNPYGVGDKELERIPTGGNELIELQKLVVPQQENSYQMCFDLAATPYAGYASQPKFQADYPVYNPKTGWTSYLYDDTNPKVSKAYFALKGYAKGDKTKPFFALGSILRIAITHWLTDSYGPLPYTQVESGKSYVPYDSQSDLYLAMGKDLQEAITALKAIDAADRQYADFDLVYKGDMTKWVKYANSLLLRMAVRMSDVDPTNARAFAEFALTNGVITDNADNAMLTTDDNAAFKVAVSWGDSRAGADIVEYMNAFSDPRREKYFTEVEGYPQKYFGMFCGLASFKPVATNYSAPLLKKDSPMVWITASEVAFLKAELALKGWTFVGDTAENLYKKGIELSFAQHGAAIGSYLSNTNTRGNFTDAKEARYNTQFSSPITVAWDNSASTEVKLSKIITQKWIAMYPYNAHEAWAEWRRTGYPNLMPIKENNSGGIISNISQVNGKDRGGMRRLPFTVKENANNSANVATARTYLGGADNGATDLWWVKK